MKPQYDYPSEGVTIHSPVAEPDDGTTVSLADSDTVESSVISDASTIKARILILFGSETGNAEGVARQLKRDLRLLRPVSMTLNEAAGLDIVQRRNITDVLCVCSTFGKGEAPSNATSFFTTKMTDKDLSMVKFSVLALGSTLYPDFCQAGVKLDKLLEETGMQRVCALKKADEASDAAETIAAWMNTIRHLVMPPNVEQELIQMQEMSLDEPPVNEFNWDVDASSMPKTKKGSSVSPCVSNQELLDQSKTTRSIRKITFAHPTTGPKYMSGDHLSVHPLNSESNVKRFLACFSTELAGYARANADFPLSSGCSEQEAVEWQMQRPFELELVEGVSREPSDVFFATPTTLKSVLTEHLDLSLHEAHVANFLHVVSDSLDKFLLGFKKGEAHSVTKRSSYQEFVATAETILKSNSTSSMDSFLASFPTIFQFFEQFGDLFCASLNVAGKDYEPILKLPEILVILPKLQQRFYSISSSNKADPDKISISVGLLKTNTSKGVPINGVCSHFLHGLREGVDSAHVAVRSSYFRLPEDPRSPLIMVGAGTGLAPMMGFLQDRALDLANAGNDLKKFGESHLFFGCRTEHDFIYADEIKGYVKKGMIKLHLAISRPQNAPKKYVQDKLADMGAAAVGLLLNPKTHVYACGDARMANSFHGACVDVLRKYNSMSRVVAVQHLKKMQMEGRWQTDVWGIVSHFESAKKIVAKNKKMAAKIWLQQFKSEEEE